MKEERIVIVRIIGGHGGVAPGFRATSYLIDKKLLIDAGSVASGLLIDEQVSIDNILISHSHLDHISDLAFLSDNCFGLKEVPFEVFSTKTTIDAIKKHLMNDVIWPDFSKIPNEKSPTIRFNYISSEQQVHISDYNIKPISVNHCAGSLGFIIEKDGDSILFTQDTGPTDIIWKYANNVKNLKAIFTEVSFPNRMEHIAKLSQHHTANSLGLEISKMPKNIPIFVGHLKPNYQTEIYKEIEDLNNPRVTLLGSDDSNIIL